MWRNVSDFLPRNHALNNFNEKYFHAFEEHKDHCGQNRVNKGERSIR